MMNLWLKKIRNREKTKKWWKTVRLKLNGHFQYYGVSGNYRKIESYYKETLRWLHKWLNRRSQKRKMNWKDFDRYLTHYPLPRKRHNIFLIHYPYDVSFIEEPDVGNPQVRFCEGH